MFMNFISILGLFSRETIKTVTCSILHKMVILYLFIFFFLKKRVNFGIIMIIFTYFTPNQLQYLIQLFSAIFNFHCHVTELKF